MQNQKTMSAKLRQTVLAVIGLAAAVAAESMAKTTVAFNYDTAKTPTFELKKQGVLAHMSVFSVNLASLSQEIESARMKINSAAADYTELLLGEPEVASAVAKGLIDKEEMKAYLAEFQGEEPNSLCVYDIVESLGADTVTMKQHLSRFKVEVNNAKTYEELQQTSLVHLESLWAKFQAKMNLTRSLIEHFDTVLTSGKGVQSGHHSQSTVSA